MYFLTGHKNRSGSLIEDTTVSGDPLNNPERSPDLKYPGPGHVPEFGSPGSLPGDPEPTRG